MEKSLSEASVGQLVEYVGFSMALLSAPTYLFWSIFGFTLAHHAPLMVVVIAFSALMLTRAFHNCYYWFRAHMDGGGKSRDGQLSAEAKAFAVLYVNAFFLLGAVVMAFFVCSSSDVTTNFVLSCSLTAFVLAYFTSSS